MKQDIKLGDKVKDLVSGFEGIAIARIVYMNGCVQFGVKGMRKNDAPMKEAEYIDEGQLKWVGDGLNKPKPVKAEKQYQRSSGGDQPDRPKF